MAVDERPLDPLGILVIHASAVNMAGKALVFLGPSSAGKTTICRLLSSQSMPLADDKVYAMPRPGGQWAIADASIRALYGPLSEDEANALAGVPLQAVFRLHKAPELRLGQVHPLETSRLLMRAVLELKWTRLYDARQNQSVFTSTAAIARSVPGYHLSFDRSHQVSEWLRQSIGRSQ